MDALASGRINDRTRADAKPSCTLDLHRTRKHGEISPRERKRSEREFALIVLAIGADYLIGDERLASVGLLQCLAITPTSYR